MKDNIQSAIAYLTQITYLNGLRENHIAERKIKLDNAKKERAKKRKWLVKYSQNIFGGSKDVIAVVNSEIRDGFRFIGLPEVFHEGKFYTKYTQIAIDEGLPKPKAIILINIVEIQTLKPGSNAGKTI